MRARLGAYLPTFVSRTLVCCALVAGGCHSPGSWSNHVPPGDAKGAIFSGAYVVDLLTLSCSGDCTVTRWSQGYDYETCTVGDKTTNYPIRIAQADGSVEIYALPPMQQPSRGAVFANGGFIVKDSQIPWPAGRIQSLIASGWMHDDHGSTSLWGLAQVQTVAEWCYGLGTDPPCNKLDCFEIYSLIGRRTSPADAGADHAP